MTGPRNARNLASLLLVTLLVGGPFRGPVGGLFGRPFGWSVGGLFESPFGWSVGGLSKAFATEAEEPAGETPVEAADGDTCRPTTAALLVRGIRMFERQEMREGLEVLAMVAGELPAWQPALTAHAGALLRSGRFAEAADGFAALLGAGTARAIARGTLAAQDLALPVDPEHVLGLAIARHYLGDPREADRLYRTYADLVEPTSERAARAYWRLYEMYTEVDVSWGDAAAERAKALAVDPSIDTKPTLPDLPDVGSIVETEPYTREIALAPGRPAPEGGLESLPVLIDWTPPAFVDLDADAEWKRDALEILVGENGHPEELALPSELDLGSGHGASLAQAAMEWCFEAAIGESGAVAAWIVLGVDVPVVAPPDSLEEGAPDTADTLGKAASESAGEEPNR